MNATTVDLEDPRASHLARALEYVPAAVRRTIVPFLISRCLIILVLAITPLVARVPIGQWGRGGDTSIKLNTESITTGLRNIALIHDASWYRSIASNGYEHRAFDTSRQANWAFFPLHPLLWKAAETLSGEWFWSGVVLSNAYCLVALALLWQLTVVLTHSTRMADSATVFAAFWPSAYFMVLPHTEALFFALTCLSALAACRGHWRLVGVAGFLASATRFNGLFLLPMAGIKWLRGDRRLADLLKLAPIVGGTLVYMCYLWAITGDPFAFKDIQVAWGRELTAPWTALLEYLDRPHTIAVAWNPRALHFGITLLGICSVITCWRRGWQGIATFTVLTLLAPLSTGTLTSMTRYLSVAPGVYLALAVWSERSPRFGQLCLALFAAFLALMCALFSLDINIASA